MQNPAESLILHTSGGTYLEGIPRLPSISLQARKIAKCPGIGNGLAWYRKGFIQTRRNLSEKLERTGEVVRCTQTLAFIRRGQGPVLTWVYPYAVKYYSGFNSFDAASMHGSNGLHRVSLTPSCGNMRSNTTDRKLGLSRRLCGGKHHIFAPTWSILWITDDCAGGVEPALRTFG